jgi:DNA-binding MarR family transcriptional regulator
MKGVLALSIFDQFWCFQLNTLSRKIARMYNDRFSPLGITLGQSLVLFYLLEEDGSQVKDIASAVKLDSPSITGLIDRLIKEELVIRKEDPDSRRSVNIFLTPKGREAAAAAIQIAFDFNYHLKQCLMEDAAAFDSDLTTLDSGIDSFNAGTAEE